MTQVDILWSSYGLSQKNVLVLCKVTKELKLKGTAARKLQNLPAMAETQQEDIQANRCHKELGTKYSFRSMS